MSEQVLGNFIGTNAAGNAAIVAFGLGTDRPVAADYDGDGKTDKNYKSFPKQRESVRK